MSNKSRSTVRPTPKTGQGSESKFSNTRTSFATSRMNYATTGRRQVMIDPSIKDLTKSSKTDIQVLDDLGNDVTPKSLWKNESTASHALRRNQQGHLFSESQQSNSTPNESQVSMFGGPFTKSIFSSAATSQSITSGRSSPESIMDEMGEPTGYAEHTRYTSPIREEARETLTEDDLKKTVDIFLTETETIFLLDIPAAAVSVGTELADKVIERNDAYTLMLKQRHGDRYTDRFMQTFNNAPKNKEIQTSRFGITDAAVMATVWDMYDTFMQKEIEKDQESDDDLAEELEVAQTVAKNYREEDHSASITMRDSSMESRISMVTDSEISNSQQDESSSSAHPVSDSVLRSKPFKDSLFVMERAITLNNYQPKQAVYRGLPILQDPDILVINGNRSRLNDEGGIEKTLPNLERLWDYKCNLTRSRNISSMAWNTSNQDILAVGYCQFGYNEQKGGFACCWSIKNPEYPERVFNFNSGVTGLDFSSVNPNLLAVGLYDGTVAIVDIRTSGSQSVLDSSESPGKHSGPVWQVKWVDRDRLTGEEHGEMLVSISTDGRITHWSIRKGFECSDLMRLKRVANKRESKDRKLDFKKSHEGLISRYSGGLSFDFCPKDTNIYLAGTEEGHIHKCSCSYNEQYLESYFGHMGPVYKVAWSPFLPDAFLSCSGDWSVRLWNQDKPKAVHSFLSSKEAVNDICWSPTSATMFACVRDRAIEVWDLNVSTLDPIIVTHSAGYAKLSTICFSLNSECLLIGDSDGHITIYLVKNTPPPPESQVEVLSKLMNPQTIAAVIEENEKTKKGTK